MDPMMKPAGDPGQAAASKADIAGQANAPGGDAKDPIKAMVMLGDSMDQLSSGLQQAGAPEEALSKLSEASAAYKDFLSILGGNPSNKEEAMPGEPKGSVPPPQPGQPGIAPVKGRNIAPAAGAQGY